MNTVKQERIVTLYGTMQIGSITLPGSKIEFTIREETTVVEGELTPAPELLQAPQPNVTQEQQEGESHD